MTRQDGKPIATNMRLYTVLISTHKTQPTFCASNKMTRRLANSPVVVAAVSWLVFGFAVTKNNHVQAADTIGEHQVQVLGQEETEPNWQATPENDNIIAQNLTQDLSQPVPCPHVKNQEDKDPMLVPMPGYNGFQAYKRADISSFYQELPGSRVETVPDFIGQAGKFVNMASERLDLYWDGGHGQALSYICTTHSFESCGTATFPNHVFKFLRPDTEQVVCSFRMVKGTSVYFCNPFVPNNVSDPSAGVLQEAVLDRVAVLTEEQEALYQAAQFNRDFGGAYKEFTGGSEWLANYPSEPPQHYMWRADYFGQQHAVQTRETHFTSLPPQDKLPHLSLRQMRRDAQNISLVDYRAPGVMNITLTVVSVAPRIFQIDEFLSPVEVDHLLDLAHRQHLDRSSTGNGAHKQDRRISNVRTSRNTWLKRHTSPILDAVIKRAADVLRIDEALMRNRMSGEWPDFTTRNSISEDLQLVHYDKGEQYTSHHDFGYPDTRPNAPTRSINLCMYLNEGMQGGETAFPRWRNAHTTDAVKAVPQKGKAMIFYMKNPDGNLDDLSQHAAMPVLEGEKWFANLWTHDPFRE